MSIFIRSFYQTRDGLELSFNKCFEIAQELLIDQSSENNICGRCSKAQINYDERELNRDRTSMTLWRGTVGDGTDGRTGGRADKRREKGVNKWTMYVCMYVQSRNLPRLTF